MLRDLVNNLLGKPDPNETLLLTADPLLIVGDGVEVRYEEEVTVELQPENGSEDRGTATAPPTNEGWVPKITVTGRLDEMVNPDPRFQTRGGSTLFGFDSEGKDFTWLIGTAADNYLREQATMPPVSQTSEPAS